MAYMEPGPRTGMGGGVASPGGGGAPAPTPSPSPAGPAQPPSLQTLLGTGGQPQVPGGPGMSQLGGGMYGVDPKLAMQQFQNYIDPMQWQSNRNAMQTASASGLSGGPLQDVVAQANAMFGAQMGPVIANMLMSDQQFNANAANQGTLQNQMLQANANQNSSGNTLGGIGSLLGGLGSIFGGGI